MILSPKIRNQNGETKWYERVEFGPFCQELFCEFLDSTALATLYLQGHKVASLFVHMELLKVATSL